VIGREGARPTGGGARDGGFLETSPSSTRQCLGGAPTIRWDGVCDVRRETPQATQQSSWANDKGANGPVPTEYAPPPAIQARARCEVGFGERMVMPEFTDIRRAVGGPTKTGHFHLSSFISGNLSARLLRIRRRPPHIDTTG
jgi:hypothetical protein